MNDKIALVIPTRGRPDKVPRALESIKATASRPEDIVVVVGVDDDDEQTVQLAHNYQPSMAVVWILGPREITLGRLVNRLAFHDHGCDIITGIPDDTVMVTQGWDDQFRNACALMPKGYGTAWPTDGVYHSTDVCTQPIITRAMMNRMGFFAAPWFPFWFGDVWLEEMGAFVGCRLPLECRIGLPDGRGATLNMRDLAFWGQFFQETRKLRLDLAKQLILEAYDGQPQLQLSLLFNLQALEMYYHQRAMILSDPGAAARTEQIQLEAALRENPNYQLGPPSERYLLAKQDAEAFLQQVRAWVAGQPR
jgi:hypothetical protein